MMQEKHLTRLLNWEYKSSVEGFFSFLSLSFCLTSPQGQEKKKAKNIHKHTKMDCLGQGK